MSNLSNESKDVEAVKLKGIYLGHSIKSNYDVELKVRFSEESLAKALGLVVGISRNVNITVKNNDEIAKLGDWNVCRISIDKNAQMTVVFKSNTSSAKIDDLSKVIADENEIILKCVFK